MMNWIRAIWIQPLLTGVLTFVPLVSITWAAGHPAIFLPSSESTISEESQSPRYQPGGNPVNTSKGGGSRAISPAEQYQTLAYTPGGNPPDKTEGGGSHGTCAETSIPSTAPVPPNGGFTTSENPTVGVMYLVACLPQPQQF
ncbi:MULTISPECIES: hypothetical protein [unclassified Leptolyngbya]|uniref:hypothetical protein n=1 Tax=unclassified Leptolyngbya TaxID=2650499 RepID=UPI00168342AB|nr:MULTISPECIES: hypothetical protein [unclassified Leptolyngbya]MBD1913395.1 hypothetical protein [Leptolyngbya sp. FACHB-8]MBD2158674.1 hypothetical protein [Leptolyngbya sp. FACHB-16]